MSKTFRIFDQATGDDYLVSEDAVGEALTEILADATTDHANLIVTPSSLILLEEEEDGKSNKGLWISGDKPLYVTTAPSGTSGWGRITDTDVEAIWGRG